MTTLEDNIEEIVEKQILLLSFLIGSGTSSNIDDLISMTQSPENDALTFLLQTYERVNQEERVHSKVFNCILLLYMVVCTYLE